METDTEIETKMRETEMERWRQRDIKRDRCRDRH